MGFHPPAGKRGTDAVSQRNALSFPVRGGDRHGFLEVDGVSQQRAGLTLLEVVLAIVLLTSLALATLVLLVPIARQSRVNREVHTADTEVKKVLERIHATPFNDLLTLYPPGTSQPMTGLASGQLVVNYVDPAADPLEIQVTFSWSSPNLGSMKKTFTTARTE